MGLTTALNNSTTGIKVASEAFDVISNNISNAHSPTYQKRVVNTEPVILEGMGGGTRIASLQARTDEFFKQAIRAQQSVLSRSETIKQYYDKLSIIIGDPNKMDHAAALLDSFYTALTEVARSPESNALRDNAVKNAKNLTFKISQMATEINELRFEIDKEIKTTADKINSILKRISDLNAKSTNFDEKTEAAASIAEEKFNALKSLAELINIRIFDGKRGNINISTSGGTSLLDENIYQLSYFPASDLSIFTDNGYIQPLEKYIISASGEKNYPEVMISGGYEGKITTKLEGGKLKGLQELRDIELPRLLERLDNLAYEIAQQFNKPHNTGGGYSPSSELIGQKEVVNSDRRDWSGKIRIAIVDENGNYVKRAPEGIQGKQRDLRPLEINLSTLNGGSGVGTGLSVQNVLDEINEYFLRAPITGRVRLGDFRVGEDPSGSGGIEDIKLVSMQSTTAAAGNFDFDFEIDNGHRANYNFELLQLQINNAASVTTTVTSTFNSEAGLRQRTGGANRVSFAGGGGGTYTITARFKITDSITNEVSVSDVTYNVTDSETSALNKRFTATSASGADTITATEGGAFVLPSTIDAFLRADIVDNSSTVISPGNPGYIRLQGLDSKYRIVIDDLTSSEDGLASNSNVVATNKGWSHYFGMNNLFFEKEEIRGSAINSKVRDDIAEQGGGNLLSIAKLTKSAPSKDKVDVKGEYQARSSFLLELAPDVNDTITINGLTFTFDNAGATATTIDRSSVNVDTITQNMVNKFNTINTTLTANGVDLANYSVDSMFPNKMQIVYNAKGITGNRFTIDADFTIAGAAQTAKINNGVSSSTPSGFLIDGTNNAAGKVTDLTHTYSLGRSAKQAIEAMLTTREQRIIFKATTSFAAQELTLVNFANQNVVSYAANNIKTASENFENDNFRYNEFFAKYREGTGVNIDEELINMIKFQASYNASAKVIATIGKMLDSLLLVF